MKKFSLLLLTLVSLFFVACNSEIDTNAKEVKFDREICERCKMVISDRNYTVQIVNKNDGKRYYHDDIGCAILWFKENSIDWEKDAIIYVTDAKTGEWLDAKTASWTFGAITPMDFGFSAYKERQDGENFDFMHVKEEVLKKPLNGQMGHHSGHKMEHKMDHR